MSSPRTQTTVTADESADPPKRLQLSPVQVAASALAAVSAAVVASFFGVAGTMIGTGLASVISTGSAALYTASLRSTTERPRRLRAGRGPAPAAGTGALPAATAAGD